MRRMEVEEQTGGNGEEEWTGLGWIALGDTSSLSVRTSEGESW